MNPTERVPLGKTSVRVTRIGMGCGGLAKLHSDERWNEIIGTAWKVGVRSFDTSPYYGYGNSEVRLGRALGKYNRDDYVLSTKVGRLLRKDGPPDPFIEAIDYPGGVPDGVLRTIYDYSGAATCQSLVESRQRLGLDRIDVVHIHDVVELASGISHVKEAKLESYPVLAELREQKRVSAIGVGAQINAVLTELGESCNFDCFLIAGRYTLLDQSALDEVLPLCVAKNISVIIGSPFNTGILVDPKPGSTFDFAPAPVEIVEKALRLKAVCAKYNIPLPAAAIQFPFAHPAVAQILTGAFSSKEIEENARLMQVKIPAELWQDLRDSGLIHPKAPTPAGA
jgi:D-threo-aldose 1-dehydrogenase